MIGQLECSTCPRGYICPGFGRIDPAICPPGYICSDEGLATPNLVCPVGFYCNNGTITGDPFRNDTTLRPYPCRPGSWCPRGVGFDLVRVGDPLYAQNCTAGFYCAAGSTSPTGSGICPPGFFCPAGTATPIPTPPGFFAENEGTIQPARCLPGTYAPTIQTVTCIPCPPGTSCEAEGTIEPDVCPPGSYQGAVDTDAPVCQSCPQGTWSKQWGLRDSTECIRCAPGTVCPVLGMFAPCTPVDLPQPYIALNDGSSREECLERNLRDGEDGGGDILRRSQEFFWGYPTNATWTTDEPVPTIVEVAEDAGGECF